VFGDLINYNDDSITRSQSEAETIADMLSRWDIDIDIGQKKEVKAAEVEKKLDQDMNDLIEYTKWISKESGVLRDRVRAAERVISDLKSSGESSVEAIMETLYLMKVKQEELDSESESLREMINSKEVVIKNKEETKASVKQTIEIQNAEKENEIHALRMRMDEQRQLMDGQRRLLNELQMLSEVTQNHIIKATKELQKKK
jgi:hypothetical protein